MTAPTAPSQAPLAINLTEHLKRKFGIGPRYWDRFAGAADGKDGEDSVPPSGAHVTLRDLARHPWEVPSFPDNDDPRVRAALEDDEGWVGTPDPAKYGPDPADLSPRELAEEVEKGNVMLWKDFKRQVSELQGEELQAALELVRKRLAQERLFFTLRDGSKVSMWDLYQYVHNNPELAEMHRRGRRFPVADPTDPAGRPLPEGGAQQQGEAEPSGEEASDYENDWGLVAAGEVWRRRPTRWLLGADGVKDWDVEVFAHEPMTNQILGRKYGGRDPFRVVEEPAYAADVVRCGPLLGMTFVLTAARDIELRELASSWRDRLSSYLQRQAPLLLPRRLRPTVVHLTDLNGATWPRLFADPTPEERAADAAAGTDALGVAWRTMGAEEHEESRRQGLQLLQSLPEALCGSSGPSSSSPSSAAAAAGPLADSGLLDRRGAALRQGAALWVSLEPEGVVTLGAKSPDGQEELTLARLSGQEALAGALLDAFLGLQPLDPALAATARCRLLLPANGFTMSNKERDPNHPLDDTPRPRLPRLPADPSAYSLPAPGGGRAGGQGAALRLSGIRTSRLVFEVQGLLERAAQAAEEAAAAAAVTAATDRTDGAAEDPESQRQRRAREAAASALREGLARLGPEARGLVSAAAAVAATGGDSDAAAAVPEAAVLVAELAGEEGPAGRLAPDLFSLARRLDAEGAGEQ